MWKRPNLVRNIAIGGAFALTGYVADERLFYGLGSRSLRAISTGVYILYQYKIRWTPENSSEIHGLVANKILDCCIENEGLYVKFGQGLSSMAFALPKEYRGPLERLHDRAKTFDLDVVKRIIQEELGDIGGEFVVSMEDDPVASASIAQVHRAIHAPSGMRVAVKVQKPNIAVQAKSDLLIHKLLLKVLEWSFDLPIGWTHEFIAQQLLSELDFRTEAANSNLAKSDFLKNPKLRDIVYVPEVLFASRKVLVTEWIDDAVKITDTAGIHSRHLNSRKVVENATELFAYQIFHTGHVHCDPHPGNLLVRIHPTDPSTHQIVLIDHGLYVTLSEKLRMEYGKFWRAFGPPPNRQVLQEVCQGWGIGDFETYAALTAMKRPAALKLRADVAVAQDLNGSLDSTGRDDGSSKDSRDGSPTDKTEEHRRRALRQKQIKERLRGLLTDTSKFPKELLFVGRCQNYIHFANWAHGNPIDRFAVMSRYAHSADVEDQKMEERISGLLVSGFWQLVSWFGTGWWLPKTE